MYVANYYMNSMDSYVHTCCAHTWGGVYKFVGMYTQPHAHPNAQIYIQLEAGERWEGGKAGTEAYSPLSLGFHGTTFLLPRITDLIT